ncbi:leucyl/phenylalanyl-tRNA--protein transferase [Deinococcus sp. SL84]|uniref:leucyl/phenylalanyl-tRNA--protein transferase n=1 Tax=Deinococcus sp. SL84 TaxID=2994663 RepID=UPI002272BE82|nr:leucyl/phenylalanyl-tRNA--protein transferase [Deinococcus sp. SL84]MCY1702079.1 leucyl/phenylalanyl-tRNA--protein transferase [Deinococcus sp. SL84]
MPTALQFLNHPDPVVAAVAAGYAQGGFLMDMDAGPQWFTVDTRALVPLTEDAGLHVSRRLRRKLGHFEVRRNAAYREVLEGCRGRLPGSPEREDGEWISGEMVELYEHLHAAGLAHSFEVWQGGELAGGVMGLALGGVFFAESKFHRVTDASKVALVRLAQHLHAQGFTALDAQIQNDHIARLGVYEISGAEFAAMLPAALAIDAEF